LDGGVKLYANAWHAHPHGFANLLVAEACFEFEMDQLTLLERQLIHQPSQASRLLGSHDLRGRTGIPGWVFLIDRLTGEAGYLPNLIERAIPANEKQPRCKPRLEGCHVLTTEAKKGLLDRVTGRLGISRDRLCVADERPFIALQRAVDDFFGGHSFLPGQRREGRFLRNYFVPAKENL
jgi:hypothetical protein